MTKNGAVVAAAILIGIGIANVAYGIFRSANGADLSPPLFSGGAICAIIGAILLRNSRRSGK